MESKLDYLDGELKNDRISTWALVSEGRQKEKQNNLLQVIAPRFSEKGILIIQAIWWQPKYVG